MAGQPYVAKLPDGRYFAVELPEGSSTTDVVTGEVVLRPAAIHLLDRLRTLLSPLTSRATPQRLRILRESLGLSQRELADQLTCQEQTVSDWEDGACKPSTEQISAMEKMRQTATRRGVVLPEASMAVGM